MLIGKKFTRFYFNDFKPITKLEKYDQDRSRGHYWAFTSAGAISCVQHTPISTREVSAVAAGVFAVTFLVVASCILAKLAAEIAIAHL